MKGRMIECRRCGKWRRHAGRHLCKACYMYAMNHGLLDRFPRMKNSGNTGCTRKDFSREAPKELCATCPIPRGRKRFNFHQCAAEGCMMQLPNTPKPGRHKAQSRAYDCRWKTPKERRRALSKYWRPAAIPRAAMPRF